MIKIEKLKNICSSDMENILAVWESSVRATHDFLSEDDIISIKPYVSEGANYVNDFLCVRDEEGFIKAFMGVHGDKIEMLFVSDDSRGSGIGKKLIEYAVNILNVKYVDVNEQNREAVGFYKHMGFEMFKRSEFDEQGNPFPILHLKLK